MATDEFVVFYAWQSDSSARENRNFIESALESALKNLQRTGSIQQSPRLDKDTKGVPGIPDIANTILDKIRGSDAFVADVSFIAATNESGSGTGKLVPNPNVMIELGYALAELGWERIILVLNTKTGSADELPFDLRNRRWPITYSITSDTAELDRREAKKKFASQLHDAVEPIAKLPPRQKRGTVEQRLSALEGMVSSLGGANAQIALLAESIAGLREAPIKRRDDSDPKEQSKKAIDSLIERVRAGEFYNVKFQQGMFLALIHPESAPSSPNFISQEERVLQLGLRPLGASAWDHRIFGNGLATFSSQNDSDAATEIVTSGVVAAAAHRIIVINPDFLRFSNITIPTDTVGIPSVAFEKGVIEGIAEYLKCLKRIGTIGPWQVALAAINLKRSVLFVNPRFDFGGRPFEGDEIRPPVVQVPNDADFDNLQAVARALRPAFDYIWREHGFARSFSYAETGDWIGQ